MYTGLDVVDSKFEVDQMNSCLVVVENGLDKGLMNGGFKFVVGLKDGLTLLVLFTIEEGLNGGLVYDNFKVVENGFNVVLMCTGLVNIGLNVVEDGLKWNGLLEKCEIDGDSKELYELEVVEEWKPVEVCLDNGREGVVSLWDCVVASLSDGIMLFFESLWAQQLPNKNPSAQVPRCFPSVFIHSHTNMHVPMSPIEFWHGSGRIWRHQTVKKKHTYIYISI